MSFPHILTGHILAVFGRHSDIILFRNLDDRFELPGVERSCVGISMDKSPTDRYIALF